MKTALIYHIVFLLTVSISAQEVPTRGVPYLDNYMPEHYGNSGKVWDIQSNDQGILFFASDKGLLEYDGVIWKRYKGSKGFTRSLHIVSNSLIYTGSDLDFGKWELNSLLEYEYTSLYPFKENVSHITEEFWDVHDMMNFIIFVSFNNIYVYKKDQLTKISAPYRFSGSYFVGESLFLVDEKFGVYRFDGISLNLEFAYPENKALQIVGIAKINEDLLIVTQNNGLFIYQNGELKTWSEELSTYLISAQAFSFTTINNKYFVFGTILNGIYITDINGRIIQHINKHTGLPNNTILNLYYSKNGMLWVSMDLGITGIHLLQNHTYVFDHAGEFGTGQTALIDNGMFYLGTNQGLYTSLWDELTNDIEGISFTLLPESAGQVWAISNIANDIICGHDRGLYKVSNGKFESINEQIGVLDIVPISDSLFLAGTYNGIHLYQYNMGSWGFVRELDLIKGACSQILLDKNQRLWVHIPNYGVIIAELNVNYNVIERKIFPIEDFNGELLYLEKDSNGINIVTDKGKYSYDQSVNKVKMESKESYYEKVKHRLSGNYLTKKLNDTFQFHPIYNGFAIENTKRFEQQLFNDTLLLRSLEIFNQDTSFAYSFSEPIPYDYNNLKIDCRIPHNENVAYRYFLEGHTEKWSDWSPKSDIKLLNLREGDYVLQVEGRINNDESRQMRLAISIMTPWYRSVYAYSGYLALLILFFYSLYKLQSFMLEQQKQKLLQKEQDSLRLQAEDYKKEVLVKRQELLEKEKIDLEKELRTTRIQLVMKAKEDEDKNRVLLALDEKLRKMQGTDFGNRMQWKELYRIIDGHQEKENNTFQIQMDELNQEFTQRLKSNFPELTIYDVRLCTYIKSGLSTREIAEMMNVLPSSINVSRSRLRKKLNLEAKDDLYSFLEALK